MAFLCTVLALASLLAVAGIATIVFSYWHEYRMARVRSTPQPIPSISFLDLVQPTINMRGKHA